MPKGKAADSISCKNQSSNTYSLYLPSLYSPDKKYPCIYFFDAHARGMMPVSAYKELAEQYGFVLVGSNASKNGTPADVTNEIVRMLMNDTHARINIDPRRIYTAGFSGGSRVACSIAAVNGGVAGVIGCAAGFPSAEPGFQNKFDYFGMVGDYDFNLTEMQKWDEALEQNGFAHQLLTSGGIHGWALVSDFNTAMLWMQVNAMKEQIQPRNDAIVSALKSDYDGRIAAAQSTGEWIKVHDLLYGAAKVLGGLTDVSSYRKRSMELIAGDDFKNAMALQVRLQQMELGQQQELKTQFAEQDAQWWAKKIAELNKSVHGAKTPQEGQMNKRLLNYLGLLGYMYSDHAIKAGDLAHADGYLNIFKMADPENPDHSYLTAVYYMKKGDRQQAMASLNEAAGAGYSEVTQLVTDPAFGSLLGDEGFKNIVSKVRANNTSK